MTEQQDAWSLIFSGQYEQAQVLLEEEGNFHNVGRIHLALGHLDKAAEAFRRTPQITSAHGEMCGVCEWLSGNFAEALRYWKDAQKSPAQDAAGGVTPAALCYYAAVRLSSTDEQKLALKALRKVWKPGKTGWPSPIAGFLLEKFPEHEFTWQEFNLPSSLEERWGTQLNFWKGVKCIENQELQKAETYFRKSYKPYGRGILEAEHFLARYEIETLHS